MSNDDLEASVAEEIRLDPRVDEGGIAVSADDGTIVLRGTVTSLGEKLAAKNAAERVGGVSRVENQIKVRLVLGQRREDADLRGDILLAMVLDSMIPPTIDASVLDGYVTLKGSARWEFERAEAEFVAGNVPGVVSIENFVQVTGSSPISPIDERTTTVNKHIDRLADHRRYAIARKALRRRTAKRTLAAVAEGLTALSLARRAKSRRRVLSLAAAAYVFDRLARHAAEKA
jgi:osmotically-inducible protein OsmY